MTQTSRVLHIGTDPHGHCKAHEVSLDVDVKRGPERCGKLPLLGCLVLTTSDDM